QVHGSVSGTHGDGGKGRGFGDRPGPAGGGASTRIIKRYSNRKLYDTVESRYVTLPQIAELVRKGEDVRIIDNNSKEDLTSVTLAQILYEEERKQSRALPLAALKDLIHTSGEKIITSLREGPVGKLIGGKPATEGAATEPRAAEPHVSEVAEAGAPASDAASQGNRLFGLYEQVDKRVREALESLSPIAHLEKLQAEVKKLTQRVEELEALLPGRGGKPKDGQ
ncbi:MAG: polyhydroxyalkanoate synthesis regulator DNA-binding domain-containing protein, partial [Deltaproteobacteria bacterium]